MECPFCAEEIKPEAKKCKHCGEWLDKKAQPQPLPQSTNQKPKVPADGSRSIWGNARWGNEQVTWRNGTQLVLLIVGLGILLTLLANCQPIKDFFTAPIGWKGTR